MLACVCMFMRKYVFSSTVDKRPVEPLHVVVVWKCEQDFIGQDGDGQEQNCTHGYRESECAQPQPRVGTKQKQEREKW